MYFAKINSQEERLMRAEDAEIEETSSHDGLCVRSMLKGWLLRDGATPTPAIKPFELLVQDDVVYLNLPEFSSSIPISEGGNFSFDAVDDVCGHINVTGRVRGQILILNAEQHGGDCHKELRLTGVLPFDLFCEDDEDSFTAIL